MDRDKPTRAALGDRLVPVTWSARPVADGTPAQVLAAPVRLRLVAGGRSSNLVEESVQNLQASRDASSALVVVDEDAPLTVEVDFDGATQTLDVASGRLDAGRAAGLYASSTSVSVGCGGAVEPPCRYTATDRRSPWQLRRSRPGPRVSDIALRAHHPELGWAPAGQLWAMVPVHSGVPSAVRGRDGAERLVSRSTGVTVTLDGDSPRSATGLTEVRPDVHSGIAVFAVDADVRPSRLVVEDELELGGDRSPRSVTVRADIPLVEDD